MASEHNAVYWPINKENRPIYNFVSQNLPTYGICAVVEETYRSQIVNNCKEDFIILSPGLSGEDGTISIQSLKYPNRYWHASGMDAMLYFADRTTAIDPTVFDKHATFILHIDQWYTGYNSFESAEYYGYYVRHHDYIHKLHILDDTDVFHKDASYEAESHGHFMI
ncbi:unnamed protein product [Owenia fusiformis]|nr:unnamed protein product [Owenia fusiformis]